MQAHCVEHPAAAGDDREQHGLGGERQPLACDALLLRVPGRSQPVVVPQAHAGRLHDEVVAGRTRRVSSGSGATALSCACGSTPRSMAMARHSSDWLIARRQR
ncbi:MAG: hypothetical protein DI537_26605 [Stutzerimonas stutzeri]|jgi:hypothetical protein|nr:MAG: hypothetical protein DI537_26605 [Stutzerimonas stutzeri]